MEVRWTTLSEEDTVGFNVMRSTAATGPFEPVNDRMVATQGDAFNGAGYSFVDNNVTGGVTYYYYIQELGLNSIIDHNQEAWQIASATPENPSTNSGGGGSTIYLPLILK